MHIQSWMIKSWATVEWYLPTEDVEQPAFWHVNTQVRDEGDSGGLRSGDTVWVAQDDTRPVGMAWEWVEVRPGLIMLADPNSIITNLQLVDSQKSAVWGLAKTVAINRLVHALPWQRPVGDLLVSDLFALKADHRREDASSQKHGPALLQTDTAASLAVEQAPFGLNVPAWHSPSARFEEPAVRPFQQRLQGHAGGHLKRSSDRDEVQRAAGVQHLRKAA